MKEISISEIKKLELEILDDVHNFCKRNGIEYCLAAGTLLGAVRHKGYIPWDDDIDILMPRKSYDRFMDEYNYSGKKYKVINVTNTKDYPYAFAKVIDLSTTISEYRFKPYQGGVYIDVFPLDPVGDDMEQVIQVNEKLSWYRKLLTIKMVRLSYYHGIKKIALLFAKFIPLFMDRKRLIDRIDFLSKSLGKNEAKYCACMVDLTYGISEVFETDWIKPYLMMPFENKEFFVPSNYDKVLTGLYGDYMKLPPKEKQITHHSFKAWYIE